MRDCCEGDGKGSGGYDLIVIGAGSAGFSAAITAADGGKRVAILGDGTIGGTCVNVGCVPSKAMLRAAEAVHHAQDAGRFPGIAPCVPGVTWAKVVAGKQALVDELRAKKYADLLPQYDLVDYYEIGPARFEDGAVIAGDQRFEADRVLIATGSSAIMPDIEGIDSVGALDSTAFLDLPALPDSLIFLGGGYVGVELAQAASRLGATVTLVTRSRILPGAEPEVAEALCAALETEGITVIDGLSYDSITRGGDGVALTITRDGATQTIRAADIVVTAGRRSNTDGMGLDDAGIRTDARGSIIVGPDMATSRPGVYAAGDVTDRDKFVYMAAYGAKIAIRNALFDGTEEYDNAAMPWVVFSDPQVAGVGLSEAQATDAGHNVKTSVLTLDNLPRALAARDTRGLLKLVADKDTDRLLGGQIVAPEGADTIQTLALALKTGMTAKDLGAMVFPYLTTVEGLKLAAQTFDMDVAKLSCCAG